MQTSQNKILQIILAIVGIIALVSRHILEFQNIQLVENQSNIIRFIAFGCLAGANYLNYKKSMNEGKTNSKGLLWLSYGLGLFALSSLLNVIF